MSFDLGTDNHCARFWPPPGRSTPLLQPPGLLIAFLKVPGHGKAGLDDTARRRGVLATVLEKQFAANEDILIVACAADLGQPKAAVVIKRVGAVGTTC